MIGQVPSMGEKHADGYVAYPLGLKGIVVGEGSTYEEALADVKSAIRFHIETFGAEVLPDDSPLLEAFVAEATIPNRKSTRLNSSHLGISYAVFCFKKKKKLVNILTPPSLIPSIYTLLFPFLSFIRVITTATVSPYMTIFRSPELSLLQYEISVLSPLRRVLDVQQIKVG